MTDQELDHLLELRAKATPVAVRPREFMQRVEEWRAALSAQSDAARAREGEK